MTGLAATPTTGLTLTGERTLPGIADENYWFRRHEAAYRAAVDWVAGARVLEAGTGEGYGAALLATTAQRVVALDYDAATTAHAARLYPHLPVLRGNVVGMPFVDGAFDAVVSLQVVEHLWDQPGYVAECARVLRPGGLLVVSTPNRLTFSPGYDPAAGSPQNPFHTREFAAAELADLLAPQFHLTAMYGLAAGPHLAHLDRWCRDRYGVDLVGAQLASPAGTWPDELSSAVARVAASDFILATEDVDRSLDLVAVATKRPPAAIGREG